MLGRPGTLINVNITCPRPPYWKADDFVSKKNDKVYSGISNSVLQHWADSVRRGTIVPLNLATPGDGTLCVGEYRTAPGSLKMLPGCVLTYCRFL
jgi:hypothetical protein